MAEPGDELVSSPVGPKQKMFQTVPSAPQQREQVPDFGHAEKNLFERRFFLPGAQHGQHSQSRHGEGDMPVPSPPVPDFIVVRAAFAFSHLESDFDGPTPSRHGHQCLRSAFLGIAKLV